MAYPLQPLAGRYWRMLGIRWQRRPFESGAHLTGGRWNAPCIPALYLSADYNTAISEMHQDLIRPGTLVAFDVKAGAVADLVATDAAVTACLWRDISRVGKAFPPSWTLAEELSAAGADGAPVPSVQKRGGINLVMRRWYDAAEKGEGAALDPKAVLTGR